MQRGRKKREGREAEAGRYRYSPGGWRWCKHECKLRVRVGVDDSDRPDCVDWRCTSGRGRCREREARTYPD